MAYNQNTIVNRYGDKSSYDPNTIEGEIGGNNAVFNNTMDDDLYSHMLTEAAGHWDQTEEGLQGMMDRISFHETGGTRDPKQAQVVVSKNEYGDKSMSEGPGRGMYQFERGAGQGGATAMQRLHAYLQERGVEVPDWVQVGEGGVDATQLTPTQQNMLFLANARKHKYATFKGVTPENLGEKYWAPYHWAGAEKDREGHIASFEDSMKHYK